MCFDDNSFMLSLIISSYFHYLYVLQLKLSGKFQWNPSLALYCHHIFIISIAILMKYISLCFPLCCSLFCWFYLPFLIRTDCFIPEHQIQDIFFCNCHQGIEQRINWLKFAFSSFQYLLWKLNMLNLLIAPHNKSKIKKKDFLCLIFINNL